MGAGSFLRLIPVVALAEAPLATAACAARRRRQDGAHQLSAAIYSYQPGLHCLRPVRQDHSEPGVTAGAFDLAYTGSGERLVAQAIPLRSR